MHRTSRMATAPQHTWRLGLLALALLVATTHALVGARLVAAAGVSPHTFPEGNSGQVERQVFIDGPFTSGYSVEYWTQDGTATAADNDYVPIARGTYYAVCNPFGDPCPAIIARVTIIGDTKLEPDETFTLHTSVGSATITITSEELPPPSDSTPPDTTITGNPTNPSTSASASFSFIGSDPGGSGVARFECQLDGGGFSPCTSPQAYTGLSQGSHTFQVRAIDSTSTPDPTPASFTWVVDTTPPDTTITGNPTNPSASANASFSFTGNDGSGTGVASFQCQLDGGGFGTCTSPQTYVGLSQGSHTFQVRAVDVAGNADATPATFTWAVDSTPPYTTITANPTNPSTSASASFSFIGSDPGGSGVASFECQLDGGGFTPCTSPKSYTGLSQGSHTVQVRAIDAAANADPTPATYTWVVDTVAPDTTITANPANPSASNSASFSFTGNDGSGSGVVGFECQLDGSGFAACASPQNYPGLADGSHTVQVRAIDAAGNTDPTPASFTWLIDTTPPTVTITSTALDRTNVSPIPVRVEFSEDVADFTADDIAAGNGSVNNFAGSGKVYTFDLVPVGQGLVTADIAADKAHDAAGNGNTAATQFARTYDSVAPTVTINQATGQSDPANASPIHFTVVFSEPVTGFGDSPADVILSGTAGATTAVVTQIAPHDGTTYDVAVSSTTTGGTVIATIPAGAARDQATNPSAASTSRDNSVTYNIETAIDAVSGATTYGDSTATLTARLRVQGSNAPLAGRTIVFTLAGQLVCGGGTGRACPVTNAQGVATLSGVPVTKRNAGTYANLACASFAGAGAYLPSGPTCGPLTVARKVLWVKPADQTVKLGQANPTSCTLVLANGSTFAPGDTWAALNLGALRCTYNRNYPATNASEYVGKTYRITAFGAASSNYDLRYQQATLTVVAP